VVLKELWLSKHRKWMKAFKDARKLRAYVRDEGIRVVHCHLPGDHTVAAFGLRGLPDVRLVRTIYDGGGFPAGRRHRRLLGRTDGLLCASQQVMDEAVSGVGYPRDRAEHLESAIDLQRFDPGRALPDGRAALGLDSKDFVVGIVARMQRHRRFEVLLEAVRIAHRAVPSLRLVVIGRGTHQDEVAKVPAKELGIEGICRFPGYLAGDDFTAALAALDLKVFLVPGSDGSCRAVREALAMGIPVVAARRGMLGEIVQDGRTGRVIDDSPEVLAQAIVDLSDAAVRAPLAHAARIDALERFSTERLQRSLKVAYESALAHPRR
jgi:glycosyltransferase involved in cell wall biosynthesis